jgi:hypothetical protein
MNEVEIHISPSVYLPKYRHLVNSEADINFLYGGRDSGKSHFIAQKMIRDCLKLPYFRCLLIKKTYNTIKESQWQTIKDIVDHWGLNDLFTFKINPLTIECVNGNKFIARGCDDPQSIKSVKDPSHAWYEEGNQLDRDDFITVTTTLRSNKARIQQWFSFNPECDGDYEDFWLWQTFFQNISGEGVYEWTMELPEVGEVKYIYSITHSTYHDNKHCKAERKIFLEQLKDIDPYYYQVYTLGRWGRRKIGDPFCFAFSRDKHLGVTELDKRYEVYLSFDFNVNPITCGVFQHYGDRIFGIESIKLDQSDIYKLCDYILSRYPGCLFYVTGDATGRNTSALVQDGINYYTVIKSKLGLGQAQLKVPTVNPKVAENRVLVNAAFQNAKVTLHPDKCKELIFDCENVAVNDIGEIDKGSRSNPTKRADHLDNFRYYLNTFHKHILKY